MDQMCKYTNFCCSYLLSQGSVGVHLHRLELPVTRLKLGLQVQFVLFQAEEFCVGVVLGSCCFSLNRSQQLLECTNT